METESLYKIYLEHPEVTTDSRRCPEGSMFFALKGESFDGNRFAAKALEAGCAVAVVDDPAVAVAGDARYVVVPDVLKALQDLAARHRQSFQGPVLQVTGTNGKTTTKELLAAVLSERYRVLYTQGNLNNHIGVPLTLLRLRPTDEVAIIETGANHPGEIQFLTQIVQPDYGLVTNVGRAHLEGFGSFEGVKRTKGELYDYLQAKTTARIFVNGSNSDLCGMLAERNVDPETGKCLVYGRDEEASARWLCHGRVTACDPMLRLTWQTPEGQAFSTQTQLIGDYNIDNVLAAVAVGLHFGVKGDAIHSALENYHPSLGRSEYRRTANNELIVDAYNANLTSMSAALDNFSKIQHPQKMVILGDMRELGAESEAAHQSVLEKTLCDAGLRKVWLVGENFEQAVAAAHLPEKMEVRCFKDVEAVKACLQEGKPEGWLILIKGSNGTKLFQLPEML
ncbi:MAG: UDP-N-acetylmuramoyl-tripeptide--D-alanyl-D-alanine ligase [Bacteroidales bacterium]|nr:UDP-N-acetylmuramoyl-tripeptide--D-alanyl-D-alanine ligase [Bacteroidales bacterium]